MSLACPEVVFLIICGVTLIIWVKVPRRGAALPRAKLRNIIRLSPVFRISRNSLVRRAPWRPPPGIIESMETGFLCKSLRALPFLLFAEVLAILVKKIV